MDMDFENKVNSFSEIGMACPGRTKRTLKTAIDYVNKFEFYTNVYP